VKFNDGLNIQVFTKTSFVEQLLIEVSTLGSIKTYLPLNINVYEDVEPVVNFEPKFDGKVMDAKFILDPENPQTTFDMRLVNVTDDVQLQSMFIKTKNWGKLTFSFEANSTIPVLDASTSDIMTLDPITMVLTFKFSNFKSVLEALG